MAIDTRAKLKSAVADAANRDDLFDNVTTYSPAVIDGMIDRAVDKATITISRDLANRGGSGLTESLSDALVTVAGTEYVDFPANTAGIKFLGVRSNPEVVLEPRDFTSLITGNPSTTAAKPGFYSVVNRTRAYLRPIPDSAYPLRSIVWQTLADLTANTTNPVFDDSPDIYEAASLVELALMLQDADMANIYRVDYDKKMNDLTGQDKLLGWAAAISGATPQVQINIA